MNAPRFSPDLLRKRRDGAGLSRTGLGFHLERSEQTIWQWERGLTRPRADQLGQLAQVLGCSVDDFFTPENNDAPAEQAEAPKNASGGTRDALKA